MFDYILTYVRNRKAKGFVPDLLFITNDLAHKGLASEYDTFWLEFVTPLHDDVGALRLWWLSVPPEPFPAAPFSLAGGAVVNEVEVRRHIFLVKNLVHHYPGVTRSERPPPGAA